jgi:putative heme transporter
MTDEESSGLKDHFESEHQHDDRSRTPHSNNGSTASRRRKVVGIVASVALLVTIFVGVIPQFASYSYAWRHMASIGPWWWVVLAVVTAVTQVSGVWVYQAALPGLRLRDGFVQIETTSAISSSVPAGGTVAIGMTYKMFRSFGFDETGISTAIIVTGVWNLGAKLGLPVIAVGFLAFTSRPPKAALTAAAFGILVTIVAGLVLWLLFRSKSIAHWLGRRADKAANWARRRLHRQATNRIEQALLDFRIQTVETARIRGWRLTGAMLVSQVVGIVLILAIVRAVGISSGRVSFLAVLTSFAVARLAGALPITPGGMGTIDSAFIGMLAAFGTSASRALAADLMWRLTTYLAPILLGIVTYLAWIRREGRQRNSTGVTAP